MIDQSCACSCGRWGGKAGRLWSSAQSSPSSFSSWRSTLTCVVRWLLNWAIARLSIRSHNCSVCPALTVCQHRPLLCIPVADLRMVRMCAVALLSSWLVLSAHLAPLRPLPASICCVVLDRQSNSLPCYCFSCFCLGCVQACLPMTGTLARSPSNLSRRPLS